MTSNLSQLLFVYVLGGLTFVPLLLAAILIPAWYSLPEVVPQKVGEKSRSKVIDALDEAAQDPLLSKQDERDPNHDAGGAASGTFAVLRKYDFPAAHTALAVRSGGHNGSNAGHAADGAVETGGSSESVYQSMYRSVFDRSRAPVTSSTLSTDEETSSTPEARSKKKVTPASIFYIVLRHGHLMLYDSPTQLEVRLVISLAHHDVYMTEGVDGEQISDGDLFIKRTAILLKPVESRSGALQVQNPTPKPFYLFATSCTEKEDFYHALMLARAKPPTPQPLDPHDMIKLQSNLHSNHLTAETRALNALLSRVFLALSGTEYLKHVFRSKVEKKMARIQKPGFIAALAVQAIDLGSEAPVLCNLRLKDLNVSGDTVISCDVKYSGGMSLTLAAQARLDLGARFKVREFDLLLSAALKRMTGHMLIRVKPPPSNRLWFTFEGMPEMDIKIEPVVGTRQINYGFILRQIEERVRIVMAETMVKPNWDDISFLDTRAQKIRGGIWKDRSGEDISNSADALAKQNGKTKSTSSLPNMDAEGETTSSGSDTMRREAGVGKDSDLKKRSVISLPAQPSSPARASTLDSGDRTESPDFPSRPFRSPSFTSMAASAPSVALDGSSAKFDPSVKDTPQRARTWGRRKDHQRPTMREAVDAVREVRNRSLHQRDATEESQRSSTEGVRPGSGTSDVPNEEEEFSEGVATPERSGTGLSTASTTSSAATSTAGSIKQQERQRRGGNLLAAATTATTAAKNWGWNAVQARQARMGSRRPSGMEVPQAEQSGEGQRGPMGRGQPLPPPGTPLPGPQQKGSLWSGSGFASLPNVVKRKPLLPRRPTAEQGGKSSNSAFAASEGGVDEFGDWNQNVVEEETPARSERAMQNEGSEKKVPPPLPKRRRRSPLESDLNTDTQNGGTHSSAMGTSGSTEVSNEPSPTMESRDEPTALGITTDCSSEVNSSHAPLHSSTHSSTTHNERTPITENPDSASGNGAPLPDAGTAEPAQAPPAMLAAAAAFSDPVQQPYDSQPRAADRAEEMGGWDEDEDSSDENEGAPKMSFSRSRDDGQSLHQRGGSDLY